MRVIHRKGWEIPESLATPEAAFLDRRGFLAAMGAAGAFAAWPRAARAEGNPSDPLYPAPAIPPIRSTAT